MNDIPERCDIVVHGFYTIDNEFNDNIHVTDADKGNYFIHKKNYTSMVILHDKYN